MNPMKYLVAASVIVSLLSGCKQNKDAVVMDSASSKNYLKVTFNGQTKVYTDVRFSESKLSSVAILDINAGSSASDRLTISVFGLKAGTYPYRDNLNKYDQVSQVEYKTNNTVFNNYKALVCPTESGYYSTSGQVKVEEYVAGKLARGSFSGALLDSHGDDCSKESVPFSGEFYVTASK
jgi:hypothetical protein